MAALSVLLCMHRNGLHEIESAVGGHNKAQYDELTKRAEISVNMNSSSIMQTDSDNLTTC